ncbi:hypothetical protein ACFX15_002236 [Malus domestica]
MSCPLPPSLPPPSQKPPPSSPAKPPPAPYQTPPYYYNRKTLPPLPATDEFYLNSESIDDRKSTLLSIYYWEQQFKLFSFSLF